MVIVTRKSKLRKKIFLYLKLSTTTVQSEPRFPFQSTTEGFEQFSGHSFCSSPVGADRAV